MDILRKAKVRGAVVNLVRQDVIRQVKKKGTCLKSTFHTVTHIKLRSRPRPVSIAVQVDVDSDLELVDSKIVEQEDIAPLEVSNAQIPVADVDDIVQDDYGTFTLFPQLPIELRQYIWGMIADRTIQVVELQLYCPYDPIVSPWSHTNTLIRRNPDPAFLAVNREARAHGMLRYSRLRGNDGSLLVGENPPSYNLKAPILFNYKQDVFYVSRKMVSLMKGVPFWRSINRVLRPDEWALIENIAIEMDIWDDNPKIFQFLKMIPRLKNLHLTMASSREYARLALWSGFNAITITNHARDIQQLMGLEHWRFGVVLQSDIDWLNLHLNAFSLRNFDQQFRKALEDINYAREGSLVIYLPLWNRHRWSVTSIKIDNQRNSRGSFSNRASWVL